MNSNNFLFIIERCTLSAKCFAQHVLKSCRADNAFVLLYQVLKALESITLNGSLVVGSDDYTWHNAILLVAYG